jgi:hypothetical protein
MRSIFQRAPGYTDFRPLYRYSSSHVKTQLTALDRHSQPSRQNWWRVTANEDLRGDIPRISSGALLSVCGLARFPWPSFILRWGSSIIMFRVQFDMLDRIRFWIFHHFQRYQCSYKFFVRLHGETSNIIYTLLIISVRFLGSIMILTGPALSLFANDILCKKFADFIQTTLKRVPNQKRSRCLVR